MTYQVKRTIVSLVTGVLLLAAYCVYAASKMQAATAEDVKFWAVTMLCFIGIGIAAFIVIQIVFHILLSVGMAIQEQVKTGNCDDKGIEKKIEHEMVEDEMDKLIELKATKVGYSIVGTGFVAALVCLALGWSAAAALNILFGSFAIGAMAEGCAQLRFYRKGIKGR